MPAGCRVVGQKIVAPDWPGLHRPFPGRAIASLHRPMKPTPSISTESQADGTQPACQADLFKVIRNALKRPQRSVKWQGQLTPQVA